ncbi:MAG TPA: beta-ketoacyl synthase N-terminal-like domain-containing protein [Polyangiaceae bacterium]
MSPIAVVAFGAVSPLGIGAAAVALGAAGDAPATRVRVDAELERLGLARPLAARAALEAGEGDRAQVLLAHAAETLARRLDGSFPAWRRCRLRVCVGTSAGGMPSLERALATRARSLAVDRGLAQGALYDGPLAALRPWFTAPAVQVLAACASSTIALGLGARWLESDEADLVIAGGYDALSAFVATGFESLGATTGSGLMPFRVGRNGMALGEGAALLALARAADAPSALGYVEGFAMTNDAVHVTAPDPEGKGLARAANAALADAGVDATGIDLVSAHATATAHNDLAEARALRRVFGGSSRAVVHPFKAVTGHCLGASGALETLAALGALRAGLLPGAGGEGPIEPEFPARLLARNEQGQARACLKLSSGFGGSNAALVVRATPGTGTRTLAPRRRHDACVLALGELVTEPALDAVAPHRAVDEARLGRLSPAGALVATALASALVARGPLPRERVGVVMGTTTGCLEENERFDRVRRESGPRAVEPKRFARTSPNVPAGECAIAFGFTGPAFAVGGGARAALEALLVATDLIAFGDADFVFAVVCDELGGVTRDLFSAAGVPVPASGARAVLLGRDAPASRALDRGALLSLLAVPELTESGEALFRRGLSKATGS